jgi:hypothetical protein
MVADDTALILALPDDTAESLLRKAGQAGARRVQLLVPDGVPGLQDKAQLDRLRALSERGGLELTLISSDPQTLRAARLSRIETMQVRNAHVVVPPQPPATPPPASPYATRVLDREPARGGVSSHLAADLSAGDAAFLDALDDLDTMPPAPADSPAAEDEDFFAALESIASKRDARSSRRGATTDDDDFLNALDSLNADEDELRRPAPRRADAPAAPKRIRPEDIELSDAEKTRATQTGRRSAAPPQRPARAAPAPLPARADAPRRRSQLDEEFRPVAPPRRQSWIIPVTMIIALLVIILVAANLILGARATLRVAPPTRPDQIEPISDMPLPLAAPGSGGTGTAVAAQAISSDVAVAVSGQIAESTMAPSGTARGTITILSLNPQPITLPAGSEFVAVKADGQEVPFISAAEVVVPPATTADQGAQIVTTRGTASLEVVARSAGSASNIDANSIRKITVPGGQTFSVGSGTLLVQHNPISGGSEDQVRIVKDSDVQRLLGDGLMQLDSQARQQLQGLARAGGLQMEATTIIPRRTTIEKLQGFDYTVSPAVGEVVDSANPTFTLKIQARYSALATPAGTPLEGQLGAALTEQLRQAGLLQPGDCKAPAITGWAWDSTRLTVSGQIAPNTQNPACGPGLSDSALQQVREAVRGKARADAEKALQSLAQQGVIGDYTLPDVDKLPSWDFQLKVEAQ